MSIHRAAPSFATMQLDGHGPCGSDLACVGGSVDHLGPHWIRRDVLPDIGFTLTERHVVHLAIGRGSHPNQDLLGGGARLLARTFGHQHIQCWASLSTGLCNLETYPLHARIQAIVALVDDHQHGLQVFWNLEHWTSEDPDRHAVVIELVDPTLAVVCNRA